MSDDLQAVNEAVNQFASVRLDQTEKANLMNRVDTKFTLRLGSLCTILPGLDAFYSLIHVDGVTAQRYESVYFDTEDHALYARHHSGKAGRHKVRIRRYLDSSRSFFEVKTKTNKGRTIKSRIEEGAQRDEIGSKGKQLLAETTSLSASDLRPSLWVGFTRFTFIRHTGMERLTIDTNLRYRTAAGELELPNLVIAELKQERSSPLSPFLTVMRRNKFEEGSMSKYCFGIATLCPSVKTNRFKERMRQIDKLLA